MNESKFIHKSHNVSVLLYHMVFPAKYRREVFSKTVDNLLKDTCIEISKRHEINFLEIGVDKDHVHFLLQSVPTYNVTKIVRLLKSITARIIFEKVVEVKKFLWGGNFWSSGYFCSTVGKYGNEDVIKKYVENQGRGDEHEKLHTGQLTLF